MERYKYGDEEFAFMENSCVPFAVYQFINKRVVTIALSKGFCDLFGFGGNKAEAYDVMDNNMYRDCHPDDVARVAEIAVNFALHGGIYDAVYRSKIGGKYKIIHAHGSHIVRENTRLAVIWYTDEGEYSEKGEAMPSVLETSFSNSLHESSLYRKSYYDYLTGLPSMTYFFELAAEGKERMIKNGETPVMLFFDLNGMKYFNHKFGFAAGDTLIRETAQLLIKYFSSENCSRFGQDHFCVYTKKDGVEEVLQNIFAEAKNLNGGNTLPLRVGIYSSEFGISSVSTLCDRAKMACDKNRNSYISHYTYFDESMMKQSENRRYIIDNLDRAIKEKWIQVYYQPIVRAATGRVCDEEALARWVDKEKGFLSPAEFIPILEDANLIYKLDLYVTDEILAKMKRQADEGLYVVPISVNLSRSDFDTCDIVSEIEKRVEKAGISRDKLTIEITESVIGSDTDYMRSQVERFQKLGFKVWMDDFGSGYSSLDVLQSFRFNLIKLDMKFMQQFYESEKSKIILTELVKMALCLGIDTICEGVEDREQVEFLKEIGCTKLQGFYFCRPIPMEKVFDRYKQGIQIGFENPAESDYFASLGKINLYDLSVINHDSAEIYGNYFNTLPMVIIESDEVSLSIVRCNKSYRDFIRKYFSSLQKERKSQIKNQLLNGGSAFIEALKKCKTDAKPIIIDETILNRIKFHVYVRRIEVNPVTKVVAFVLVVLGVTEEEKKEA